MKILLLNTTDLKGGAAIASYRLLNALLKKKVDVKMLVRDKFSNNENVFRTGYSALNKMGGFYRFAAERLSFSQYERSKDVRFSFSPANTGEDISNHPLVKEADIIHLNWINFGFLSLTTLDKLLALNKKFVWTLHDMWAFTGGCHYSGTCSNFTTKCNTCPFLKNPAKNDLSSRIFLQKQEVFKNKKISFVCCSRWLTQTAQQSKLLQDFTIQAIPNPIDTDVFKPMDKKVARAKLQLPFDKKLILFGADIISDKRKGFSYLIEAMEKIYNDKNLPLQIELVTFGNIKTGAIQNCSFKINYLPYLKDTQMLTTVYSAADVFVLPTLEDNLPNTVMETMACGTPVVAFNTGGIPEMINHKENGYIASYRSTEDLANGILEILQQAHNHNYNQSARHKVITHYSENLVAEKYLKLYETL